VLCEDGSDARRAPAARLCSLPQPAAAARISAYRVRGNQNEPSLTCNASAGADHYTGMGNHNHAGYVFTAAIAATNKGATVVMIECGNPGRDMREHRVRAVEGAAGGPPRPAKSAWTGTSRASRCHSHRAGSFPVEVPDSTTRADRYARGKGLAHYYSLRVDEVKLSVKRLNSWAPVLGRCSQTRFAEIFACARAAGPVSRNQPLPHDRRLRP
jgi:hypothetical protein